MKASLISILSNLEKKHKITFNNDTVVIESGSLLVGRFKSQMRQINSKLQKIS
jgi:hypothetical protein